VAIEPATGRILAMTSHSSIDPHWEQSAVFDLYPMASLFKIVTASAALENRRITPETMVEFRGKFTSENPRYWEASPRGRNNRLDVTYAMGKSVNPVYGRVAADIAGKTSVMESVHKFGFNQALLPGTPAKESTASEPQGNHELMLMGAGLDHDVKISPLHAAVMMAAIANGGRMMSPGLTEKVVDSAGTVKDTYTPKEIRRLVTAETAASLTRMLSSTVTQGTSRKAFHDRRGRPRLAVEIAAKTGSINGNDPKGHYSWFAAFAPARNPRIALVALVINQDRWKIKSSQVGELALEEFFNK
jgi:cell division protein FtsI/penicillin-binding protein 2